MIKTHSDAAETIRSMARNFGSSYRNRDLGGDPELAALAYLCESYPRHAPKQRKAMIALFTNYEGPAAAALLYP